MDKNFRVRWLVGLCMFGVSIFALYTFDSIPFKILFVLFSLISAIELLSFFHRKFTISNAILAILEIGFLVGGIIFAARMDLLYYWYIILGVCGYDIFAYLFGKAIGGMIFKKSRPFPHISKNKTWEGTILGLILATTMVTILMLVRNSFNADYIYLLCGPLALIGDLFESFLKRRFEIKDSNEIVIKNKIFAKLELVVGGSEGHGGFLDRIDSIAFSTTVFLLISLLI